MSGRRRAVVIAAATLAALAWVAFVVWLLAGAPDLPPPVTTPSAGLIAAY